MGNINEPESREPIEPIIEPTIEELFYKSEFHRGEQLEQRLQQLTDSGETDGFYGREFMVASREIQKIFKRDPCPLTPEVIKKLGLNLYGEKKPTIQYTRFYLKKRKIIKSGQQGKQTTQKDDNIGDETIQLPPSSRNAWKPSRQKMLESVSDEEATLRDTCQNVRALLNKVTPTTKRLFIDEFLSYDISSKNKLLTEVVEIVLKKAFADPIYCDLYVQICQAKAAQEMLLTKKSLLKDSILTRIEENFHAKKVDPKIISSINREPDLEKREKMKLVENQKFKEKRFGLMTCIGYLYFYYLLDKLQVRVYIRETLKSIAPRRLNENQRRGIIKGNVNQQEVFYGLHLLEFVGKRLDSDYKHVFLTDLFKQIKKEEHVLSSKNLFKFMKLVDLREDNWKQRGLYRLRPRTIEDIRKEVERKTHKKKQKKEEK
ncbi:hypothetical protein GCK72_005068 [Caenorhabditis remanei]|uniref:MIF4G domain-containing protein n=1 Tax=Caenorhabditis remanei TaxID=31234 RepID=A0A6A5HE74_CAERE|nr:hypothetical protein GCK72_005068 [Caenorhabditis remanei]KAF1765116.1 hypothetical protein GCK72_005068 [Caenorhabditis remanei]